jgi:hypothetical protein
LFPPKYITDGKNIRYRYGFSVTQKEVVTEYLFAILNVREVALFTREKQEVLTTDYFREEAKIKSAVRQNCSFLSVCAQTKGEIATTLSGIFGVCSSLQVYKTTRFCGKKAVIRAR